MKKVIYIFAISVFSCFSLIAQNNKKVTISINNCPSTPLDYEYSISSNGTIGTIKQSNQKELIVPKGFYLHLRIKPYAGNPLNGLSTLDVVLIVKHIIGTQSLSYEGAIAADVNNNGKVTTSDVVELKRLILGIKTDITNNWVVVPPPGTIDEVNEFLTFKIDEDIDIPFTMVKVGDVNFSHQCP
jgi:hypothetical protein